MATKTGRFKANSPNLSNVPKPEPLPDPGAFRTLLRGTDPGKLYLAAALFEETETRKAEGFYYLGDVASRAYYVGTQKWPFRPAQLSYLLRDAVDKAEYLKLPGLCEVLRPLFRAALYYDLYKLERNAAVELGRFALWRDDRRYSELKTLVNEDCGELGYGFWWTEANDREVRKRL